MRADGVKVILVEPWNDVKLAQRVADGYVAAIEYNVTTLARALK